MNYEELTEGQEGIKFRFYLNKFIINYNEG